MTNAIPPLFLAVLFALPAFAAPALENLALGKPYAMTLKPTYALTRDAGDAVQLTDGAYAPAEDGKVLWDYREAVGWVNCESPFGITVDLGKVEPVAGYSMDFAAGSAGVTYPNAIFVYTSDDGKSWRFVCDLYAQALKENPPPRFNGYETYVAKALLKPSSGRYVQFVVNTGRMMFVSEIEIYRGTELTAKKPTVADPIRHSVGCRVGQRLRRDLDVTAPNDAALEARIDAFSNEPGLDALKTVLPLNGLHREIWAKNAQRLRAAGFLRPALWTNDRWENLDPLAVPPQREPTTPVVRMMRNEVRSTAVNLVNPTDRELACTVSVEGLPNAAAVDCREVLFTDTKTYECVSGALRPGDGASVSFALPAGVSKQVWISFARPTCAAGRHDGAVVAKVGGETFKTALRLVVEDIDFPKRPRCHLAGCDYLNGDGGQFGHPQSLAASMAMVRDLYTDVFWGTLAVRPQGAVFDGVGALVNAGKLDYSAWDAWTARFPEAFMYCVFMPVNADLKAFRNADGSFGFMGEKAGTPRFSRMVESYFGDWYAHVKAQGIDPRRVMICLVDEPAEWQVRYKELPALIVDWARPLKRAAPEFVVYEDPAYEGDPRQAGKEMYQVCDVICPQVAKAAIPSRKVGRDFYLALRERGKRLWLYSCSGPVRLFDPISYFRQPFWLSYQWGAEGFGFWAFGDCAKGDSWHAYCQPGIEYTPYFQGVTDVMAAKQSEAIKEGVQDYEYLAMLDDAIAAAKASGRNVSKYERMRDAAMAEALNQTGKDGRDRCVLADSYLWKDAKDRDGVERARLSVLDMILELKHTKGCK